jgi:hypothetical protein
VSEGICDHGAGDDVGSGVVAGATLRGEKGEEAAGLGGEERRKGDRVGREGR